MEICFGFGQEISQPNIRNKGKSIVSFPDRYVVVDIETTGLSTQFDSIIEIGAIKVCNSQVVDRFQTFVKYDDELPLFIVSLTGITDEMLSCAPPACDAIKKFYDFVGDDIVVGYNVNFDINFLYDCMKNHLNVDFNNDYIDCIRISRKLFPEEEHHRLKDMVKILKIQYDQSHRALADCEATMEIFEKLHKIASERSIDINALFKKKYKSRNCKKLNAGDIKTTNTEFDEDHPLYGKLCVFTGTLSQMQRREAMQHVVDLGGEVGNNVTSKTNFLILGTNDYTAKDKSGKHLKAEELILKGKDLLIISEDVFYEMLAEQPAENSEE